MLSLTALPLVCAIPLDSPDVQWSGGTGGGFVCVCMSVSISVCMSVCHCSLVSGGRDRAGAGSSRVPVLGGLSGARSGAERSGPGAGRPRGRGRWRGRAGEGAGVTAEPLPRRQGRSQPAPQADPRSHRGGRRPWSSHVSSGIPSRPVLGEKIAAGVGGKRRGGSAWGRAGRVPLGLSRGTGKAALAGAAAPSRGAGRPQARGLAPPARPGARVRSAGGAAAAPGETGALQEPGIISMSGKRPRRLCWEARPKGTTPQELRRGGTAGAERRSGCGRSLKITVAHHSISVVFGFGFFSRFLSFFFPNFRLSLVWEVVFLFSERLRDGNRRVPFEVFRN